MPMTVQHDRDHDQLHLIFRDDRIIVDREWVTPNAVIALAGDGEAVEITIWQYYSNPQWLFDEHFVELYGLGERLEDLRLVYRAFFAPPEFAVKYVAFEGEDGEEVIVSSDT